MDVVTAAVLLESGGVLPAAGGLYDQTGICLDALMVVLRQKAEYDEIRHKQAAGGK